MFTMYAIDGRMLTAKIYFITSLPVDVRRIAINVSCLYVCLFVCLSAYLLAYLKSLRPNFTKFCVRRGLNLAWRSRPFISRSVGQPECTIWAAPLLLGDSTAQNIINFINCQI